MKNKHSFHTAALAGWLAFTMSAAGQQVVLEAGGGDNNGRVERVTRGGVPEVQAHLKGLAEKLGLAEEQSARIKPILEELHDAMQKVAQDKSLSGEESPARLRGAFETADRKIREFLDGNQKRKLDELEKEMHRELHGGIGGNAGTGPARAPQGASEFKGGVPKVEQHLKLLAEKLGLSVEQLGKVKPILQEMHDASEKIVQAGVVSREEIQNQMKVCWEQGGRKLRELLDDGQKQKLDELERAAHSDLHGAGKGAGAGSPEPPGQ